MTQLLNEEPLPVASPLVNKHTLRTYYPMAAAAATTWLELEADLVA